MNTEESNRDPFPPQGVDLDKPSVARVYDYYLGGDANWAIDREFGDKAMETFPMMRPAARANRQFLFRAVRHLMRLGIRQYIDLGAGVPTMDHTHSVADAFEPGTAKVVYVDNEPVAVAHSQLLLEKGGDPSRHTAINADIRAPERLWRQVAETGLIDLDKPIGLLMIALLHVKQADEHGNDIGEQIVATYRDLLPRGSYLVISHVTMDGVPPESAAQLTQLRQLYAASGSSQSTFRTRQQVLDLFGDFDIVEPGLTWVPSWHPEEVGSIIPSPQFKQPNESACLGCVGRKP